MNMANNRINRYIGAIALGTVLLAVPGCTDTWDDHYSNEPVSGTTKTLWDVINDPSNNFSRFADIVKNAKYYKDNTHAVPTYTYEDILKGGQVNTVWIPDNDALSEEEYLKWMQMLGESRADGEGANDAYNVQQQFLGNHIALWRHNISDAGVDTVKMINGKNLVFDKGARTLEGIPLGEYNIPTANGVVHVLKGIAPFRYNFYEYLKYRDPLTEFGKYVVGKDTTYFSASRSIEGLPDENGNPTYVDSVYFTSNRLFETKHYLPEEGREKWLMTENGFDARINNEDSVFVMVMPTDAAWNETYNKLAESHQYAARYEDKSKGDISGTTTVVYLDVPDTLQDMSIKMDLVSPLVFNIHKQPKVGGEMWTLDSFKEKKGDGAEYLLNTYGDTLRAVGDWQPSDLFVGEPTEMSNGIAYEVDSWNFPTQYYTPDVNVEIEHNGIFYNIESNRHKLGGDSKRYTFSNGAFSIIADKYGRVSNNNFYHLTGKGPTDCPNVDIKLFGNDPNAYVPNAQVMSGKYDIQVVLVPHWYVDIAAASKIDRKFFAITDTIVSEYDITDTLFVRSDTELDTTYIKKLASTNKYKLNATLSYNDGTPKSNGKDKTLKLTGVKGQNYDGKTYTYDGLKVDTLTLVEDFEFPVSYKNMRFSYPTIYIQGGTGKSDAKEGYVYDLVIDKIILKRKN